MTVSVKGKLVTVNELSEMLGVTRRTISNYVNQGMPTAGVNPADARAHMFNTFDVIQWRTEREVESTKTMYESFQDGDHISFTEAKRRREVAGMYEAELKLAESLEQVANIDDIMDNVAEALVGVRAKIVSRSSRLSGILAHRDEGEIFELLNEDTVDLLEGLSSYLHEYKGD